MKEINVREFPKCDFCKAEGVYDAPTSHGAWANMCEKCLPIYGGRNLIIGSKRVLLKSDFKNQGQKVQGVLKNKSKLIKMIDDVAIWQCPLCKTKRDMETDAEGTYQCEKCGASVTYTDIISSLF